ncbi:MAG: MerR family transcriptional regulator [Alphaproteobacteria bacterium]
MTDVAAVESTEQQPVRPGGKSAAAFRTISEVATELSVPSHVLRFWETKFTKIRPMKRGGGRRYYRPEDIALLRQIRSLLYDDGYTIKGVQKLLRDGNQKKIREQAAPVAKKSPPAVAGPVVAFAEAAPDISSARRAELKGVLDELVSLRKVLDEI